MSDVFIDASSAILLYKAGLFKAAARFFPLVMARAVAQEVFRDRYPGAALFQNMVAQGRVRVTDISAIPKGLHALGNGEQETLGLIMASGRGGFIIMDDGKGARFCLSNGIPFINALLVPKIFWYSGAMDEHTAIQTMKTLTALGRYSRRIVDKAFSLSRQDLAFFIPKETRHENV